MCLACVFSLAKSRTNNEAILKTYQLFIYEEVNCIIDSYCVSAETDIIAYGVDCILRKAT